MSAPPGVLKQPALLGKLDPATHEVPTLRLRVRAACPPFGLRQLGAVFDGANRGAAPSQAYIHMLATGAFSPPFLSFK